MFSYFFFFFQAEDGIRDKLVTGVQTCALPISHQRRRKLANRAARGPPSHPARGARARVAQRKRQLALASTSLPQILARSCRMRHAPLAQGGNRLTALRLLVIFRSKKKITLAAQLNRGGTAARHDPWRLSRRRSSSRRASVNIASGFPALSWPCATQASPPATSSAFPPSSRPIAN